MTTHRRTAAKRGAGFTLVELLIVIVIIGLLAGLTTTVVVASRRTVNNAVISTQMSQVSMALDEYKNRYGEYPPDLSDSDAVIRHLKKRWPRYNPGSYNQFIDDVRAGSLVSSSGECEWDLTYLKADRARRGGACCPSSIVFWLGGLPDSRGIPSGFYAVPKAPLGSSSGNDLARPERTTREKSLFSFDKKNLIAFGAPTVKSTVVFTLPDSSDVGGLYLPGYALGGFPVVYFKPSYSASTNVSKYVAFTEDGTNINFAAPYQYPQGSGYAWFEEERFQLIHPGADGSFGQTTSKIRDIAHLSSEEEDNLTNFTERGTLGDYDGASLGDSSEGVDTGD